MALLLGIDIGTSACKVALFDADGRVVSQHTEAYPLYEPSPGFAEQNPAEWWTAICRSTQAVLSAPGVDTAELKGVGVAGQSWSAIAVDAEGRVLLPTPIWIDNRSAAICERLNDEIGADEIFRVSGNPLKAPYTTGKILWYRENCPAEYACIHRILQSNSFVVFQLTGHYSQDKSQGYGLHCFDMRQGVWDTAMAEKLTIPLSFLPPIYACDEVVGQVTAAASALTGIPAGVPVVAGGLDAACGTLGAGVIAPGQTQEQSGQAEGMSICTKTYSADPRLIFGQHVVPGCWLLQGGTTGGGGVMKWIDEQFGAYLRAQEAACGKSSFAQMDELAAAVPAGSEGVLFLPYMAGERSPIWDVHAKGVFYGLDFFKTKGHLLRAAMEGVAYSLKHNLMAAADAGAEVSVLRSMGGGAKSALWMQIKADITEKTIEVAATDTATTLGAAILAGIGSGVYQSYEAAVARTVQVRKIYQPNAAHFPVYRAGYARYLQLYHCLKDMMQQVGRADKE